MHGILRLSHADGNLPYPVEPYFDCFGCDFTGADVISNLTKVSSHELCEAITDADLNGWSDDNRQALPPRTDRPPGSRRSCARRARVLQVFYRAPGNTLRTFWREPAGTWQGEQTIGGNLAGNPYTAVVP